MMFLCRRIPKGCVLGGFETAAIYFGGGGGRVFRHRDFSGAFYTLFKLRVIIISWFCREGSGSSGDFGILLLGAPINVCDNVGREECKLNWRPLNAQKCISQKDVLKAVFCLLWSKWDGKGTGTRLKLGLYLGKRPDQGSQERPTS